MHRLGLFLFSVFLIYLGIDFVSEYLQNGVDGFLEGLGEWTFFLGWVLVISGFYTLLQIIDD